MYASYQSCRKTTIQIYRKPTDRKGGEKVATVVWPEGFGVLPKAGGWDDQDYFTYRLFMAALQGEQEGVAKNMAKK